MKPIFFLRENKMLYKQKPKNPYEHSEQDTTENKNSNYCHTSSNRNFFLFFFKECLYY